MKDVKKIKIERLSLIKLSAIITALLTVLLLGSVAWAASANITEFSAEFVENDNGEITKGKIYIADGVSRLEVNGKDEIIVTRQDKKVVWLIFPKLSRYVEQPLIGEPMRAFIDPSTASGGNVEREFIDYEWVDSYRLRKFLVTVSYPGGQTDKYHEWFRDNFPVPVKSAALNGTTSFEYQKIKIGPQDPGHFTAPSKRYKKVTIEEIIAIEEEQAEGKKR